MIAIPEGFDMALLISNLVTYVGMPLVGVSLIFAVYRIIMMAMSEGSK